MYCLRIELFIIGTFQATFQIVVAMDNYGTKGSNITLICPFMKGSSSSFQWSYINVDLSTTTYSINENINTETLPQELYTRLSVTGNYAIGEYNLQIHNIRESDEGRYRCETGIQVDQQGLYLIVPPSSVSIENVTSMNRLLGTEGQDMMVSCVAVGGKPPPNVTLNMNGTSLASGNQSVKITLRSISRSHDRKTVMCLSNNEANLKNPNSYSAMFYLNLRPLQPLISQDPVKIEETKPLLVSCTSNGSRPQATFKWMIGQATITSGLTTVTVYNTSDDTYTVTSTLNYTVDGLYNKQQLTCSAYNNVFTSGVVTSTTLDVKFAPNITVTNMTYDENTTTRRVICIPFGNPTTYTYYKWQHKSRYGQLIRELDGGQDGVLTLPSVPVEARYQDTGEYVCTASNGITGRDGKINKTGSGYVTVNGQPTFTNNNSDAQFGVFGKDVDIHVYVHSVPKYTSLKWYKINTEVVKDDKYYISELAAIVHDTVHGTVVQLDGYRVTLNIKNLVESDFNISYSVDLSNGVGQTVRHTILLLFVTAPQTPINFTLLSSTESSIVVQWEAGYDGGHAQTFYLQFRRFGSSSWVSVKIPEIKQVAIQTFTLSELQDDILFELMMYAENMFRKSLPTETKTITTIKDTRGSSTDALIRGVAGGLSAVIFIMFIIIIASFALQKNWANGQKSKAGYSSWEEETVQMEGTQSDKNTETVDKRDQYNKTTTGSAKEYETLAMRDNPNTYSEILTKQGQNQSEISAQEYETLGMKDNPNAYSN